MKLYRAQANFGPWHPGDEFLSDDPMHAAMAERGVLLREVHPAGEDESGEPDVHPEV